MHELELSKQYLGHSGEVRCGCLLPNGRFITGGLDAACLVWDFTKPDLTPSKSIFGNSDFIYAMCPHAFNTEWFLAGSKDKSVTVFDSITGEKMMTLETQNIHKGPVCSLAVFQTSVVVGSWDGSFSVWNLETAELVSHVLNAGAHAVTVASSEDMNTIITGSQDKTLKFWSMNNPDQLLHAIPDAHSDIIRSICVAGPLIVTASNDRTIKVWCSDSGNVADIALLGMMVGHTNFIFSVAVVADLRLVVSASEDRTVKVWSLDELALVQTVQHPGTVWFAKPVSAEGILRIATGCSDTILRQFTSDINERALDEEIQAFKALCVGASQSEETQVDPATVPPESDILRYRGKKQGEIKMFKDINNVVFAYQWTQLGSWEKVGLVTGSGGGQKRKMKKQYGGDQYFQPGEYDFIFDVELGSDRMALLPYNAGDNPLVVAEKFCAREVINKSNVSQIVDFIKVNAGSGSGGVVPSQTSVTEPKTSSHFPLLQPLVFREAKWPQLEAKIHEVNNTLAEEIKLNLQEVALIDGIITTLQKPPSHTSPDLRPVEISVVHTALVSKFPADQLFVVFDLWRLFVLNSAACVMYKDSDGGGQYILTASRALSANLSNNTGMCAARYLANLFSQSVPKWAAVDRYSLFLPSVVQALVKTESKNTQIACSSVVANLASALSEKPSAKFIESGKSVVDSILKVLRERKSAMDEEAAYRLLVGLGAAVVAARGQAPVAEIREIVLKIKGQYTNNKVHQCVQDILQVI